MYNIHGLLYLSEDARQFGCSLNKISCFSSESYLQIEKKSVKVATNSTAQIIKKCLQLDEPKINEQSYTPNSVIVEETDASLLRDD